MDRMDRMDRTVLGGRCEAARTAEAGMDLAVVLRQCEEARQDAAVVRAATFTTMALEEAEMDRRP